jgi:amino acid transporter
MRHAVEGGARVTTVRPVELAPEAATARRSRAERSKLRRELGRLDAVCLLIAAIVVLDTLGVVAKGGAQTLTLLAVVAVCFFVPAGLVIAELGAAFPNQGGPYVWTRLAFGRYAGSLVALIYFLETPIWVGGSLAITTVAVVAYAALHGIHRPPATWSSPGRCSPWSLPCWSTTSSASSCRRPPARSCATRPATSRPRSSAPAS